MLRCADAVRLLHLRAILSVLAALMALKRKKRYEKQQAQIDGTLSTIEFQREALENAQTNTEVLKNMGYAAKALKAAHSQIGSAVLNCVCAYTTDRACVYKGWVYTSRRCP